MSTFKLEAFLNPNLSLGAKNVTVAFTVSGSAPAASVKTRRVVGLVIDTSGSMDDPAGNKSHQKKIEVAKHAARVFVDTLPEDCEFFIVGFSDNATAFVPRRQATPDVKRAAHAAIQRMEAGGGTFLSLALQEARKQLQGCEGAICVVAVLTDGDNAAADSRELARQIEESKGVFAAHCRGFGTDWKRAKLQPVSDALMGTIGLIADPEMLEGDFRATLAGAMGKSLSDLRLRFWMPKVVTLSKIKQMFPTEVELTERLPVDQRSVDIPLGAWGQDSQDYQATFTTNPRDPDGTSTAICRLSLVYTDPSTGKTVEVPGEVNYDPQPEWGEIRPGVVESAWTDNASLTMRVNKVVNHYNSEGEKGLAKQEFAEAWDKGDEATATVRLQRVEELARQSGDEETKRMVRQVAEVDESTGTVTLRRRGQVDKAAVMDIEVASQRTVRARRG